MKKVLLLGAGMVAKPLAEYLLKFEIQLTIASRTVSKAEKIIGKNKNGTAINWTMDNTQKLEELIADHDLTISLLPYTYHIIIAGFCLKYKKNMVTTSYVSEDMQKLDKQAKDAGIVILNEIGVDPGLDHMTAMKVIQKIQSEGGKIHEFYSLCGALPAPEEIDNPFGFKFTWSPKGTIMAGNNGAKFLNNGKAVNIPTENLFKNPLHIDFPEIGPMEVYPNRDSLVYLDIYNLTNIKTLYRGTFRYPNWCETMDALKALGMLSYELRFFEGKTYKEVVAEQISVYPKNVKEKVAERLKLELNNPAILAMEWLGLFDNDLVNITEGSTFELTSSLMQKKMMLREGGRDMVIMLHTFLTENKNGKKEVVRARLLEYGTDKNTAIARVVGLPAAIAVKLLLDGKIKDSGVKIPVSKAVYEPVLDELKTIGISMTEEWGLPASEIPENPWVSYIT